MVRWLSVSKAPQLIATAITCCFVWSCARPYYGTLIEALPDTIAGGSTAPRSLPAVREGSAFDVPGANIAGAVVVFRSSEKKIDGNEQEAILRTQQKASQVGATDIVAIQYKTGTFDKVLTVTSFEGMAGLLEKSNAAPSPGERRGFIVCYLPPITGTDDQKEREELAKLFGNVIWAQLVQHGYFPVEARWNSADPPETVEQMRGACPTIAGLYLTGNFTLAGGSHLALQPGVIGFSREAGVEFRLTDLNSEQLVWRKDGHWKVTLGWLFAVVPDSKIIPGVRVAAIENAFVAFPNYSRMDGPAEM